MVDAAVARKLQNIHMAGHILTGIGSRIVERVTHAGLRREMHDPVEIRARQCPVQRGFVADVGTMDGQPVAARSYEFRTARFFQRDRIIIVEIVDADQRFAAFEAGPAACMPIKPAMPVTTMLIPDPSGRRRLAPSAIGLARNIGSSELTVDYVAAKPSRQMLRPCNKALHWRMIEIGTAVALVRRRRGSCPTAHRSETKARI